MSKYPILTNQKHCLFFVDGFSKRISSLIDSLFNIFGLEFNYIGGGASSLDMQQNPCFFTNNGLLMDSAVLALLDIESGIGVCHG
ncbi:FIST N-terminal domain-containing protein [Bacteroidota bacterium]